MFPYVNVAQAVYLRPWAIRREVHDQICAIVRAHVEHGHLAQDDIDARLAAAPRRQQGSGRSPATVAIIPIHGVIMPRASLMSEMSGGTSVERLRDNFRAAIADNEIDGIVLDIDSPGGIVDGVSEFATELRAARGQKPIIAVANTMAASAAYWFAAQADEIFVTPSGEVGSIGVFSKHEDWSKFWEEAGVKTTLISAGKFKTEGNEFEPLADDAKAHFQSLTDDYYGMFVRDVAAGRNDSPAAVRDGYAQGRMLTAKRAVAEKLADRIGTLEDAIAKVARQGAANRSNRGAAADGGVTFASVDVDASLTAAALRAERERLIQAGVPDDELESIDGTGAITDRQVELEEEDATADPDHDDGTPDEEPETEATVPPAEYYVLRARRRERAAR